MAEEERNNVPEQSENTENAAENAENATPAEGAAENAEAADNASAPEATEAAEAPAPAEEAAADPQTGENTANGAHVPNQYVPGEPKKGIAEFFRIVKERRLLRKDLKSKGITKRKDFEEIAESLGLVLWKLNPFFLWWHHALKALMAGWGLKALIGAAIAGLATIFLVSTITEEKGSFTINFTGDMLKAGYVLSETADFSHETSRLFADKLKEVNNITMTDIDPNVDKIDGPHNGNHYFAYTFYIKNGGQDPSSYAWFMKMRSEVKEVSDAVWIMLFEDGKQVIYTRSQPNGNPEEIYGFDEPIPFTDSAYDPNQYYQKVENGLPYYGIVTTPYANDEEGIVAQGVIENVQPGEVHKYTVVLWVEGYDPECTDDRFGGHAKFEMEFDDITDEDKESVFDGVYRTEYEDYGLSGTPDAALPPNQENGQP